MSARACGVVAGVALALTAGAAEPGPFEPGARFARIDRQNGLSHVSVFDVLQDRAGFMWFATGAGLDRFDGHAIHTFRHDPEVPGSLSDDQVNCLLEASDGSLWIGTDAGVNRLGPDSGIFQRYLPAPDEGSGSRRNRVMALAEDRAGRIWTGTLHGLHVLDPASGSFVATFTEVDGALRDDSVLEILVDAHGGAWVATEYGIEQVGGGIAARRAIPLGPVEALALGPGGELLAGTVERGVVRLEPAAAAAPEPLLATAVVHDLFVAPDGVLWVATGAGLVRYDTSTGERLDLRPDPLDPGSLSHENVTAVYQDDRGVVWAATWGGGVNRLDDRSTLVEQARHRPADPGSLSHDEVMSVLVDRHATLWVGTWGGGLNRLDPGADRFTVYREGPADGRLGSDRVTALLEDTSDRLWVGTRRRGLNLLDRSTGRFEVIPLDPDPDARTHMVHAIAEDPRGRLWLGTSGGGLVRFEPESGTVAVYRFDPDEAGGIADDDGWDLLVEDRWLWIASSAGLLRMDLASERFTAFRRDPDDPASLPHNRVICLARDDRGRLWVGTDGGLAVRTDTGFRRYSRTDGLPSERIRSIVPTRGGTLWIATDVGLARLDPESGAITTLPPAAGAQEDGYFANSAARDDAGRLYFGGMHGLTRLAPATLQALPPPRVALTSVTVRGRPVALGALRTAPAPSGAADVPRLELQHGDTPVALEFTALAYSDPERHRFRYRLAGAGPEWTATGADARQAVYHRLRPGRYTFEVRAANADGVWTDVPLRVPITVHPAWWMTWWARAGLVLLILAVGAGAHTVRLRALASQNRLLERTVADRTAELRRLQQVERLRLGTALESIGEGIVITDPEATIQYVNPAFERITGYRRDEALGQNPRILQSGAHDRGFYEQMWATITAGQVWKGAFVDRKKNGGLYDVETTVAPIREDRDLLGYVAVTRDVTERRRSEQALRDSEARLRAVFTTAADGILTVDASDRIESCNPAAAATFGWADPEELVGRPVTAVLPELVRGPGARAPRPSPRAAGIREMRGLRENGSQVPIDITISEVVLGEETLLVCIVRDATERHRRLEISRALEGARRELAMARAVQERLLPAAPPVVEGLDIAGTTVPAESVAGDYHDYMRLRDGSLAVVVADASGHGLGPALMMTQTRAYLYGLVDRMDDIADLLGALNTFVHANSSPERFVTMFIARIDPAERTLRYCGAGHRALLVRAGGEVEILPATGIPLGVREHLYRAGAQRTMASGDLLVLSSDGLEETRDPQGRELGIHRIGELACEHRGRPAAEVVAALYDAGRRHAGDEPERDDITVVVVRAV